MRLMEANLWSSMPKNRCTHREKWSNEQFQTASPSDVERMPQEGKRKSVRDVKRKVKLILHTKQERLRVANISLTIDYLNTLLKKVLINDQVCLTKCHVC